MSRAIRTLSLYEVYVTSNSVYDIVDDAEDEDQPSTSPVYTISSFGADYVVDGIIARLDREDIYRPSFQRQFVWSLPQASRFIESILMGLPIPGIFLYREEETQKQLIIDGLQRLTTLQAFQKGNLPKSERRFRLNGIDTRYNGKTLDDLDPADKRRFFDTTIHATIIQQKAPEDDFSSVYHIFDRLNSGGTPLQPQEIRAAIYHGRFQDTLEALNEHASWRTIYGGINKRGKDQELILRFLALLNEHESYESPMRSFLNNFMHKNRNASARKLSYYQTIFYETCDKVVEAIGERPFRPERALNAAVLDSAMVAIATSKLDTNTIGEKYKKLIADERYQQAISRSTSDESSVRTRVEVAIEYLS